MIPALLLAAAAFSGNPCSLVSSKQVASFGIPPQCKSTTLKASGLSSSNATWAGALTPTSPHLSISVATYESTSSPLWNLGLQTLDKLPGGPAKKVSGIGSLAYESSGTSINAINFVVGKQIVDINMRTASAPKSRAAFEALAKAVAKEVS
jgi:hypothetical protein